MGLLYEGGHIEFLMGKVVANCFLKYLILRYFCSMIKCEYSKNAKRYSFIIRQESIKSIMSLVVEQCSWSPFHKKGILSKRFVSYVP